MRIFFAVVVLSLAASIHALAQNSTFDEWKLYGGYQYTHLDTHAVQDALNLEHVANPSIPQLNFGNYQNMNGWNFGVEEDTLAKWFGVVIDVGGGFATNRINLGTSGGITSVDRTRMRLYTFMAGPQFTLRRSNKIQPFARVLLGGGWGSFSNNLLENNVPQFVELKDSDSGFAFGGGIGSDFFLSKRFGVRIGADYVRTAFFEDKQNNLRGFAGVVFRF